MTASPTARPPPSLSQQRPKASRCHLVSLTSEATITQAVSGVSPRGAAAGLCSGGVPDVSSGGQQHARREQRRDGLFFGQPCSTPRGSCEESRAYQLFMWTVETVLNEGRYLDQRPTKG